METSSTLPVVSEESCRVRARRRELLRRLRYRAPARRAATRDIHRGCVAAGTLRPPARAARLRAAARSRALEGLRVGRNDRRWANGDGLLVEHAFVGPPCLQRRGDLLRGCPGLRRDRGRLEYAFLFLGFR